MSHIVRFRELYNIIASAYPNDADAMILDWMDQAVECDQPLTLPEYADWRQYDIDGKIQLHNIGPRGVPLDVITHHSQVWMLDWKQDYPEFKEHNNRLRVIVLKFCLNPETSVEAGRNAFINGQMCFYGYDEERAGITTEDYMEEMKRMKSSKEELN